MNDYFNPDDCIMFNIPIADDILADFTDEEVGKIFRFLLSERVVGRGYRSMFSQESSEDVFGDGDGEGYSEDNTAKVLGRCSRQGSRLGSRDLDIALKALEYSAVRYTHTLRTDDERTTNERRTKVTWRTNESHMANERKSHGERTNHERTTNESHMANERKSHGERTDDERTTNESHMANERTTNERRMTDERSTDEPRTKDEQVVKEEKEKRKETEDIPPTPPIEDKENNKEKEEGLIEPAYAGLSESSNEDYDAEAVVNARARGGKDIALNIPMLIKQFNKCMARSNIPGITSISNRRRSFLLARIKEYGMISVYRAIILASRSPFLNGGGSQGFTANFDWIFRPNNFPKVLEGQYNDRQQNLFIPQSGINSNADTAQSRRLQEYAGVAAYWRQQADNDTHAMAGQEQTDGDLPY